MMLIDISKFMSILMKFRMLVLMLVMFYSGEAWGASLNVEINSEGMLEITSEVSGFVACDPWEKPQGWTEIRDESGKFIASGYAYGVGAIAKTQTSFPAWMYTGTHIFSMHVYSCSGGGYIYKEYTIPMPQISTSIKAEAKDDGSLSITATGSGFITCDTRGTPVQGWTTIVDDLGKTIGNGYAQGSGSSTTTSIVKDRGAYPGSRTFTVRAYDCSRSLTASTTVYVDQTPEVSMTTPVGNTVSSPFNVAGTINFKPTLNPIKGYVYAQIAGYVHDFGSVECRSLACNYDYNQLFGKLYDGFGNLGGPYLLRLIAYAPCEGGNVTAIAEKTFYIKNCDIKIDSLTGTSQMLDPSSGGSVGIKGTISDSSGQGITWTLSILDQTFTGSGKSVNATWNGKYADGTVVKAGKYTATLTAQTADGKCTDNKPVNFTVTKAEEGQCGLYVQFGSSAHMASGNLSHSQELFSSHGGASPVGMSLYYNSLDPANRSLGRGWSHSYDVSLKENSNGSVLISEGNWRHKYYTLSNGVYTGHSGNYATLAKNSDGTFVLTHKDGQVYTFANGKVASIADRNGNTTAFAYSDSGNLATVTDPSGRTITFTYDSSNHLASLTDPSGNSYVVTVGDALTSVTQPDGGAWNFTYDANSYMLTKTDPLGNVTSYTYDDQHRAISSTDPEGRIRSITYPQTSETVKTTSFTEKDGGVWNYSYDTQKGYLLSKTDPQGGVTSYGYNANGNRTSTTNPDGTGTTATYDNSGNMLTSTDALGQTTSYTYNSFGQVTGITDPQGGTTTYAYDIKGNLITLTDPAGATTKYEYDTKGNVTSVTDAAGQTTGLTYDSQGNLASVTDSSGAVTSYSYDSAGNVTSITDAKGAVTQFIYDSRNRLTKSIDPNGNATLYSYDLSGNKLSDTDANGNITRYEYNSKNQLIKTTDAMNNSTTYSYGGSSCPSCGGGNGEKLTSLSDANGNVTMYLYDQLGRLTKETDPKGNETSYAYDAKGNLTSKTDANGNTITYSYDANSRLLKKTYPDNTEESFTYDPKGNILSATNKDIAYNFSYDGAGRMTSSMDSNSRYLQYSYDNTGKKTKTIYPEGSVVSYAYDGTGRLATITNGGGRTYGYSYDKLGRRTKTTYPNGATANYGYDSADRLTSLVHKQSNGKNITSFSYTHDRVGNRLTKAEPDNKTSYAYDAIYRLLQALPAQKNRENDEGSRAETYSYDPTGNRLTGPRRQDAYTYGTGNQLLMDRRFAWSYDKNGNQTATAPNLPRTIDKEKHDDEHQEDKDRTYTYDFENRLIKTETRHDDETTIVSFKYDPFGRRIVKTIAKLEHGKMEEKESHTYVYDGQAIILEYETGKDEDHKQKTKTTKYVHGPNIDEPLSMQRDGDVYYYHSDGLGSIVALTDKKQKVVEKYEYDSFGNLKGDTKPMQPFTYTGREWDRETGLYYYRARYYDPMEGRFISKDPIGFKGGINLYNYTDSNPVNRTDPTGEAWNGNYENRPYKPQDQRCSEPADGLNSNKCYKKCCKEHDDCYEKYKCNMTSWLGNIIGILPVAPIITNAACQMCNAKAVACMAKSTCTDCE